MRKKFEMIDNELIVTVETGDKLWLPNKEAPEGKEYIGTYIQSTEQTIGKDKAHFLREFIAAEKTKGDTQAAAIDKKLEELKDVSSTEIDADVVKAVKEQIGKGTKVFKQKMLALNTHIEKVALKQQLLNQKEYIAKEVARINLELEDIDKVLS